MPKELLADVKARPLEDGESRFRMARTNRLLNPVSVVVFRDTSADGFYVLSNVHDPTETELITRRKKGHVGLLEKDAPVAVADYNRCMGFVDSMNHMKVNYDISLQYKHRWYMGVLFYVLELSIINALVIFRQFGHPKVTHLAFREKLLQELVERAQRRPARQAAAPFQEVPANLQQAHIIVKLDAQQRCAYCYSLGKKDSKTSYGCATCKEGLHAACFLERHENFQP